MTVLIRNLQRKIKVDDRKVTRLLKALGEMLGLGEVELSIVFVNDRRMRELNRRYRSVDKTTDVLSFPLYNSIGEIRREAGHRRMPTGEGLPVGDIVINLHQAARQARERDRTFLRELTILLIHGLLHLTGYDHEANAYQARKMRKKEAELLYALEEMDRVRQ